jgi:lactate permease
MFQQSLDPVAGSLALSALCAALPLLTLFVLLGALRVKAWIAGLVSLGVSLLVAIVLYGMPAGQALLAASTCCAGRSSG